MTTDELLGKTNYFGTPYLNPPYGYAFSDTMKYSDDLSRITELAEKLTPKLQRALIVFLESLTAE